jgi:Cdc6-like AAA superfamily ATPase
MTLDRIAEEKFAQIMGRVLSPSRAIESPELLKGRDDQLREIRRAWYQGGRQIFIYGYRGVGKTSLAQTAAHQHQSSEGVPIRVICEQDTTFYRVVHDIFSRAFPFDP